MTAPGRRFLPVRRRAAAARPATQGAGPTGHLAPRRLRRLRRFPLPLGEVEMDFSHCITGLNLMDHATVPVEDGMHAIRASSPSMRSSTGFPSISAAVGRQVAGTWIDQFVAVLADYCARPESVPLRLPPRHFRQVNPALADVPAGREDLRPVQFFAKGEDLQSVRLQGRHSEGPLPARRGTSRPEFIHQMPAVRGQAQVGKSHARLRRRGRTPVEMRQHGPVLEGAGRSPGATRGRPRPAVRRRSGWRARPR